MISSTGRRAGRPWATTVEQRQAMAREYVDGKTVDQLSAAYSLSDNAVRRALRERGVTLRRQGRPRRHPR